MQRPIMFGLNILGIILCAGLALMDADVDDFDEIFNGYEFIFHDTRDLGVIIHGDNCYFLHLPDYMETSMDQMSELRQSQAALIDLIRKNDPSEIHLSSLETVRDKYQDRLANFHCYNKTIYEIRITLCPSDWTGFEGSCYKFHRDHVDYNTARDRCNQSGSHLAEITSHTENEFVKFFWLQHQWEHMGLWIGLNDRGHEGRFVLPSSGQQPSFTHWAHRQPDNFLYSQNCVMMRPFLSQWIDTFCWEKHPYICEIE